MSGSSASFWKTSTGFRVADTGKGDRLQDIAARELGDASLWVDLAYFNNLLPPYITDDPAEAGPNVLLAGTTIQVPASAAPVGGISDPAAILGTDAALVNGEITDDGAGDLLTVSGVANLKQALDNRLATETGELLFHLDYGNRAYRLLGQAADPAAVRLGASFVSSALKSDPRVDSTSGVTATIQGDAIVTTGTVMSVDSKQIIVGASRGVSG